MELAVSRNDCEMNFVADIKSSVVSKILMTFTQRMFWTFKRLKIITFYLTWFLDRYNSVGIATRYGLNGPGNESRWGLDFPHPSRLALVPTQPPVQWIPVPTGDKTAEAWRWPPITSSAKVKERVELYFYSPSGPSWPVLEWNYLILFLLDIFWCLWCFLQIEWFQFLTPAFA
jgi:hypothetical protein